MAFLDWRKLNFFDLQKNFDGEKIAETLIGATVTATTSGFNFLIIGDAEGSIHLVNRSFQITTFRAYNLRVDFLEQSQVSSLLVSIGADETGINPQLKVWNLDKTDLHDNPLCVRITRLVPTNRNISSAVPASCLCVADTLNLMAVGFADGSINLFRGDITRSKSSKVKTLKKTNRFITSLAFRTTEKSANLFVTTIDSVFLYNILQHDELLVNLDDGSSSVNQQVKPGKLKPLKPIGCKPKCSTSTESLRDCHFMIANEDAIYCYTSDVRGPCYAMDGEKILLSWFRTYLIIISKNLNVNMSSNDSVTVTVLDVHHKLIVCSQNVPSVTAVLIEWGLIFILTSELSLHLLAEKHIQARLTLLFKKNLYDVAIRMAKNHQYDVEGLTEIFRQYGDHLYAKGDHQAAIEQYIKTIGNLEPSYVICKFLGSQQIDILTTYLNALHKEKVASGDHTTLLLNCYTKLNSLDKLNSFIMTEDKEVDFDVEVAIKACRGSSIENALKLAKKHRCHDWYLTIKIEDQQEYDAALDYIARLPFDEATDSMKKHGSTLLHYIPSETTQFLKTLCTHFTPKQEEEDDAKEAVIEKSATAQHANPIDFIPMFLNKSKYLVEFLEHLVQTPSKRSELVYHTLVEHYLRTENYQQVMRLLESSNTCYDKLQVLILCHNHNFVPGMLLLYEENKMYSQILNYHLVVRDHNAVLATCNRFGHQNPWLWLEALFIGARRNCLSTEVLTEILSVIGKKKLLSPLLLVEELVSCSNSSGVNLGAIRSYLETVLKNERSTAEKEHALANKYRNETAKIRNRIREIQTSAVVFQSSRCSACNNQLELPSVHFLCQHSFHQHCFQSYAESEKECPACLHDNQPILDRIQSQEKSREVNEIQIFHSKLERAEDGFSLVADYFGRGVFRKRALMSDAAGLAKEIKKIAENQLMDKSELDITPVMNHYSSESKFIDMFGASSQQHPAENHTEYSSSYQNNVQNFPSSISSSLENRNLISNETLSRGGRSYDDSKNPFVNDDTSKNPFLNDDYDDNLNPFV